MVRPWRRKNWGRKITNPKISVLMVMSIQLPTKRRCNSGGASSASTPTGGVAAAAAGAGGRPRMLPPRWPASAPRLPPRAPCAQASAEIQGLAQVPDDKRADAGNHEQRPPTPSRHDQVGDKRGCREAGYHQERHE